LLFRTSIALHVLRNHFTPGSYDVIYVRATAGDVLLILVSKLLGVRSVLEVNGAYDQEAKMFINTSPALKTKIIFSLRLIAHHFLGRTAYHLVDRIVTVTSGLRDYLVEKYHVDASKIGVFTNGVNTDLFFPRDSFECKAELGLDRETRYVGFVGRLAPWQGVDILLRAFSLIYEAYPGVRLVVVGDGSMRSAWTRLSHRLGIADKVIWTGSVEYWYVPYYIGAFVAGVASKQDLPTGLSPLKVYEYLACGKPIIASRVRGLEFIQDRGVGFLFELDNPTGMASCLKNLLDMSESQRAAMEKKARRLATSEFSWQSITECIACFAERG